MANAEPAHVLAASPRAGAPRLSVVIVNFNTREQTLDCIRSVRASAPAGTEVIVVDNGSSDGSVTAIAGDSPGVIIDPTGENLGFARGVNRGVAQATGDYVLLLNSDATVLTGSLEALVTFARQHPHYGVYGGRTLHADGSLNPSSCWGAPTLWSLSSFALGLSTAFHGSRLFDPESLGTWKRDTVREVPVVSGCLLLTRRDDWLRLGGMDETFFLYAEDVEFSLRAAAHGLRPVIVPDAVITHAIGGSTGSRGVKMCMIMAGKVTLLRKSWAPRRASIGIALLAAGVLLRAVIERATKRQGGMWTTVWTRRQDWLSGYPSARTTLFGLPIDAS